MDAAECPANQKGTAVPPHKPWLRRQDRPRQKTCFFVKNTGSAENTNVLQTQKTGL